MNSIQQPQTVARRKRKRKLTIPSLHNKRNVSELINVRQFQRTFENLFQEDQKFLESVDPIYRTPVNLDVSDAFIPTPEAIIEAAITNEINADKIRKQLNRGYRPYQRKGEEKKKNPRALDIDKSMVPTISQIQQTVTSTLKSLEDEGKKQNALMLPRKEMNYVTPRMQEVPPEKGFLQVNPNEVVLRVAFFHAEKNLKTQEFLCLGSQKLTALRDALYCLNDHILGGKDTRSGYFYIENCFYNDMRDEKNFEMSDIIMAWASQEVRRNDPGLGKMTKRRMEDTTFYDLNLRINEKYLYCHQGNCKHFIIFTEVRLFNDTDQQNYHAYPIRVFQSKVRRRKCNICEIYSAKWVTYKDKLSAINPTFYCDNCFRQLHYDQEGKLLYDDFEVFRYFHE